MPILLSCACGKTFRVDDSLAGRRLRCKGCGAALTVPRPPVEDAGDGSLNFDAIAAAAEAEAAAVPSRAPVALISPRDRPEANHTRALTSPSASRVAVLPMSDVRRQRPEPADFDFPGAELIDRIFPVAALVGYVLLQLFNFVVTVKQLPDNVPSWPIFLIFAVSNLILFLVLIPLTMSGAFVIAQLRKFELPPSMYMRTAAALMAAVIVTRLLYADAMLDPSAYAKRDAAAVLLISQGVSLGLLWLLWRLNVVNMVLSWIVSLIITVAGGGAVVFVAVLAFNLARPGPAGGLATGTMHPSSSASERAIDPDRNLYRPPSQIPISPGTALSNHPPAGMTSTPQALPVFRPPPVQSDPTAATAETPVVEVKLDAGKPLALLTVVDVKKDALSGDWTLREGGVVLSCARSGSGINRFQLPAGPTGGFELSFTFNRREGEKEFCVIFPVSGRPAQLWLGGMDGQSSSLEGAPESHAASDAPRIVNGQAQKIVMRVGIDGDRAACNVTLDGKPYITWTGPTQQLSVAWDYKMPDPRCIGLVVHPLAGVQFQDIQIRAAKSDTIQKVRR